MPFTKLMDAMVVLSTLNLEVSPSLGVRFCFNDPRNTQIDCYEELNFVFIVKFLKFVKRFCGYVIHLES